MQAKSKTPSPSHDNTRNTKVTQAAWASLAFAGAILSGCTAEWDVVAVDEDMPVTVTEVRDMPSFTSVHVTGHAHVTVTKGGRYSASVNADEMDVSGCRTWVRNGILEVDWDGVAYGDREPAIEVSAPFLASVTHDGSGDVFFNAGYASRVNLELNGEGNLDFRGNADQLNATVNGGGVMTLEGEANSLTAKVNSWGALYADPLLAGDIVGSMSGSGDLTLAPDAGARLEITVSGSGYVEWWGNPGSTRYYLLGSGKIIEHQGLYKKGAQVRTPRHGSKPKA